MSVDANSGITRSATIMFTLQSSSSAISTIEKININQATGITKPKGPYADLLDVVFNSDGSATDISPMNFTVMKESYDYPFTIEHNSILNQNVVHFKPIEVGKNLGVGEGSFYKIDYEGNTDFINMMKNGFSMLVLFKSDYNYAGKGKHSPFTKIFSTQEAGGAGIMIQASSGHNLGFLPYIGEDSGTSAYTWVDSDVLPSDTTWYEAVGVWDKAAGKLYFYVNGEKKSEVKGQGNYTPPYHKPPTRSARWIGIGCDSQADGKPEGMFGGTIAIARMYSKALTQEEIRDLWNQVKKLNE